MEELLYLKRIFPVKVEGDLLFNALKDKQLYNAVKRAYDNETTNYDLCKMVNARIGCGEMFNWQYLAKVLNQCSKEVEYIDRLHVKMFKALRKIWSNKLVAKLEENLKNRGLNTVDQATYNAYLSFRDCSESIMNKKYANKQLTEQEEKFIEFVNRSIKADKEELASFKQNFSKVYKGKERSADFLLNSLSEVVQE